MENLVSGVAGTVGRMVFPCPTASVRGLVFMRVWVGRSGCHEAGGVQNRKVSGQRE